MYSTKRVLWAAVAAALIATGGGFGVEEALRGAGAGSVAAPLLTPNAGMTDLAGDFRAVHEAIKNAVVNIDVRTKTALNQRMPNLPSDMKRLFPNFDFNMPQQQQETQGTGSGVIVDATGHILTNAHVVDGATDIDVHLADGRDYKATLVGEDPKTDLAVVKIDADHLTYARFGNSDALQAGDWVLAFGSPFGFDQTMTQGIISAKGRDAPIIEEHNPALRGLAYENFLQTDAAINPGNSGGPLVNLRGEVVGINTAIVSRSGSYNGIGLSIPSNEALYVMKSLIEHGKVIRGYLGIGIEALSSPTPEHRALAEKLRKEGIEKGVLVGEIRADGPASGVLHLGDVITGVNDKPFGDMADLREEIAQTAPGSSLKLRVLRDGKTEDVTCKVGTQPETETAVASAAPGEATTPPGKLGVRVENVDPATAAKYQLSPGEGALVEEVSPGSLADQAGISAGDVVTRVGSRRITSASQFAQTMAQANLASGVQLAVRSNDGTDRLVYVEKQ